MKLGKRTVYCLMLALVCVNILARIPSTDHETGVDSFFIHHLATSIADSGRIPWVVNALGYFGWYPLSYPNAGPLMISGLSVVADVPEEAAILGLSMLYGILGALVAFLMARSFLKDDLFALSVATIFSLAPRFMIFTLWSASSRSLFMVLIPAFVWALVRSYRRPTLPNIGVLVSILLLMIATHRLTILLAVVVIAFVGAYVFMLMHRVIRIQWPRRLLSPAFRRWVPSLALLWIVLSAVFMIGGTGILDEYTVGALCTGDTIPGKLCNLSVSIMRSVGLALPFAVLGIFEVVRLRNKGFLETFIVLALLSLLPTLFLREYTGFYILPFLALLAGYAILAIVRISRKHRRLGRVAVVASLLATAGFGFVVLQYEVGRATSMNDATYTAALYLESAPAGNFVTNNGLMGVQVSAISGRGGLPVGGASTTHQSPELLAMGAVDVSKIQENERRIPLTDLTIEDDSPFYLVNVDARTDWVVKILGNPVDTVKVTRTRGEPIVSLYRIQYFLEDDTFRSAFTAFGTPYRLPEQNRFAISVHQERYKIYDGTYVDLYLAFEPLDG